MFDKQKLIGRSRLPHQLAPRPLGQPAAAAEQAKDDAGDVGAVSSDYSRGRDAETLDEGDFYQQLLKELIESGAVSWWRCMVGHQLQPSCCDGAQAAEPVGRSYTVTCCCVGKLDNLLSDCHIAKRFAWLGAQDYVHCFS